MKANRSRCDQSLEARGFQGMAQRAFNTIVQKYLDNGTLVLGDKECKKLIDGNLGYAEYKLNNPNTIKEEFREKYGRHEFFVAHSRVSSGHFMESDFVIEGQGKYAIQVNDRREIGKGSMERWRDTESKILEHLITIFDSQYTDNEGWIKLYTDREPCLSCDHHIIEFTRLFPRIELTIYYEYPYNIV
ncbi:deaminase domain-containing protein [Mesobacillus maritimus]|uniref:deaminase domain-containing protein n=1 Tax=Mesobacillus maritimus TaxID=1643336 RepID=UPI00384B3701